MALKNFYVYSFYSLDEYNNSSTSSSSNSSSNNNNFRFCKFCFKTSLNTLCTYLLIFIQGLYLFSVIFNVCLRP